MRFPSFDIQRCLLLIGCLHATSLISPLNAADQFSLTVVADRESGLYEVGEQATFLISVRDGDQRVDQGMVFYAVTPVSDYLAKPKDAESKSLPAILWVHGAGVRSSSLPNAVKGARAGMLSLDNRGASQWLA